ncbi:MAG: hypothetical protein U0T82_17545 [Bacteroidales bacterium]
MKNYLPLVLILALLIPAGLSAQDKNVKKVRIVIDENGKKTDTSFVVSGKDDDEVNKLISVMLEDKDAKSNSSQSTIVHSSGQPHTMFVTVGDDPSMGSHSNVMVMKKIQGDSLQLTLTMDDSSMVNVEKNIIIKSENGKIDTIVLEGRNFEFPPMKHVAGMPIDIGEDHRNVQVIVGDEPMAMNSFSWNEGPDKKVVMVHRDMPGMPAQVEIKDVAKGNELMLNDLSVFSMAKGRLMLNFSTGAAGELKLKVTDSKKKEVFSQSLKYFDGEFHQEIQLGPDAQGSYILTITQGKKSTQKEITVR